MDAESRAAATEQQFQRRQMDNRAKNQQIQAIADDLTSPEIEAFAKTFPGELVAHMFTWVSVPERNAALTLMFDKDFGPAFRDFCLEMFRGKDAYKDLYAQFKRAIARHKLEVDLS